MSEFVQVFLGALRFFAGMLYIVLHPPVFIWFAALLVSDAIHGRMRGFVLGLVVLLGSVWCSVAACHLVKRKNGGSGGFSIVRPLFSSYAVGTVVSTVLSGVIVWFRRSVPLSPSDLVPDPQCALLIGVLATAPFGLILLQERKDSRVSSPAEHVKITRRLGVSPQYDEALISEEVSVGWRFLFLTWLKVLEITRAFSITVGILVAIGVWAAVGGPLPTAAASFVVMLLLVIAAIGVLFLALILGGGRSFRVLLVGKHLVLHRPRNPRPLLAVPLESVGLSLCHAELGESGSAANAYHLLVRAGVWGISVNIEIPCGLDPMLAEKWRSHIGSCRHEDPGVDFPGLCPMVWNIRVTSVSGNRQR